MSWKKKTIQRENDLNKINELELERDIISKKIDHTNRQLKLIKSEAPGFLSRLFNRKKTNSYKDLTNKTKQQLVELTKHLIEKMQHVADSNIELIKNQTAIRDIEFRLNEIKKTKSNKRAKIK